MTENILALLAVVDQHEIEWAQARNVGYYRTEVDCKCGAVLMYGQHDGDPIWENVWAQHRVDDIEKRGVNINWPAPDLEHRVRQEMPWPPHSESTYMLTKWVCTCGWESLTVTDSRGNPALQVARDSATRHEAASTKGSDQP